MILVFPKMNVMVLLMFKPVYYGISGQHDRQYTTENTSV